MRFQNVHSGKICVNCWVGHIYCIFTCVSFMLSWSRSKWANNTIIVTKSNTCFPNETKHQHTFYTGPNVSECLNGAILTSFVIQRTHWWVGHTERAAYRAGVLILICTGGTDTGRLTARGDNTLLVILTSNLIAWLCIKNKCEICDMKQHKYIFICRPIYYYLLYKHFLLYFVRIKFSYIYMYLYVYITCIQMYTYI